MLNPSLSKLRNLTATISLLLFLFYFFIAYEYIAYDSKVIRQQQKCGYANCPKIDPNKLNVHLIAHSHNDIGWVKTIDQYYYGSKDPQQTRTRRERENGASVKRIIDSVVQELLKDPNKRFIYVESAFFFKWWNEQRSELQEQVKQLVNEGRLEFAGGAWSMNDEATTHYQGIIDQFAWGLRRLNDTFGECGRPRIGWQIDPFGHSREMASIFAQMGYDGLFFGRLDYEDKKKRLEAKKAEMIWRASANLGETSHLFTGVLYNQYQPPPGFCWDILCADEPIVDDIPDNNVNRRVDEFLNFVDKQSRYYRTNNIIITMGDDFTYQEAHVYYENLDKLIRYVNDRQANGSKINLLYSTPSCYLKALHDTGITWPTKIDDFFPLASDPHVYWTGFFTSRPTLKRYERVGNHILQVCKQLTAITPRKNPEQLPHLILLREAMGVMQHHDALTGVETENVAFDYARRLNVALSACGANMRSVLNYLTNGDGKTQENWKFEFKTCEFLNISSCDVSENNDNFILTLYNPLAHVTFEYVRIPVSHLTYNVLDGTGLFIQSQIVPIPGHVMNLEFRISNAKYELIFLADNLPPLGYKSYYISKSNDANRMEPLPKPIHSSSFTIIGNEHILLTFDTNGYLTAVSADGMTRIINQEFLYYVAADGSNSIYNYRPSSSTIFRPKTDNVHFVTKAPNITVYRGVHVEEVHQQFNNWISQVVRVYRTEKFVEFEWQVGPIPIEDNVGKEIITRFNSDIKSKGIFYTDSNGREMIKRLRDHRDTWNVNLTEHTAGNYYPITTKIALEDEHARMALLTDRAQGGSSILDGSLELMVHRRLLFDDRLGVDEALNETAFGKGLVARGMHYLIVGSSQKRQSPTTQSTERFTQLQKLLPALKFFSSASQLTYQEWFSSYTNIFSCISLSLPHNIHLMTFEPWHDNEILIRFEHILEKNEDPEFSKPIQFNLKDVLRKFNIESLRETTLDGNAWLSESHRLKFMPDPEITASGKFSDQRLLHTAAKASLKGRFFDQWLPLYKMFIIELEPMQIRTFILVLKKII